MPDGAQAEDDALLGPEGDGRAGQPPRGRVQVLRLAPPLAAPPVARDVHRRLETQVAVSRVSVNFLQLYTAKGEKQEAYSEPVLLLLLLLLHL